MKGAQELFTQNFKILLAQKGISRKDLSLTLNIPYSTVEGWYSGKTYPRAKALDKLADFFKVDIAFFLRDPDNFEIPPTANNSIIPEFVSLSIENRKKVIDYIHVLRKIEIVYN